ncbi:fibronectin type III domain-containing protein [Priestia megaterium]
MKFKKNHLLNNKSLAMSLSAIVCLSLPVVSVQAQEGDALWIKSYGGSVTESLIPIAKTSDGGFITAGYTYSADGDISTNKGMADFLLAKFDSEGNKLWMKSYGGSKLDYFYGVKPTTDGGYIAAGFSSSSDNDIPANKGNEDMIIAKFDSTGNKEWIRNYGGTATDYFYDVVQIPNGDYIAVGYSYSTNGDITSNKGSFDAIMARFDSNGNKVWMKNIGGSKQEAFNSINLTKDGNLILASESSSSNGELLGTRGYADMIFAKYDYNGNQIWAKSYGGNRNDYFSYAVETSDGGFVGVGYSDSTTGDLSSLNKGGVDATIIKVDKNGNKIWMKSLGGTGSDTFYSVVETPDGGYIANGSTTSPAGGDIPAINGVSDVLVVKYDSNGNVVWKKAIGGTAGDNAQYSAMTNTGDYLFTGATYSPEYIQRGGFADAMLLKVEGDHTPPVEVANLGEMHNHNSITLTWTNPTEKYFDHVNVYREGVLVQSVNSNFFSEIGLIDGTNYDYRISTVDRFGNESIGTMLHIKTIDITAPAIPVDREAVGKDGTIQISWATNAEPDFLGYNIYVNGVKQNSIPIQDNHYQINGLNSGETYQISITALDTSNNESPLSEVIDAYVFDTIAPNSPTLSILSYNVPERKLTLKIENNDSETFGNNLYINGSLYNTSLIQEQTVTLDVFPGVYNFSATALDQFLNESSLSQPIELVVDGTPPEIPTNITAEGKNKTIKINWDSNNDVDLAGYNVYLNEVKQNSSLIDGTYYEIPGVEDGETYQVSVSSIDTSNNESAQSNSFDVKVIDTIAPNPPNITITNYNPETQQLNIKLMTNDMDTTGFNLYLNDVKNNSVLIKGQDSLVTLTPGTYRIAATAVDDFGNESISSSVLTFTVEEKKTDTPTNIDKIIESIKNRKNQITGKALELTKTVQDTDDDSSEDTPAPVEQPKKIKYVVDEQAEHTKGENALNNKEATSGTQNKVSISTPKNLETKTTGNKSANISEEEEDSANNKTSVSATTYSSYTKKVDTTSLNKDSSINTDSKKKSTVTSTSKTDNQTDSKWILWASIGISVLCLGAISFLVAKIFKTKP